MALLARGQPRCSAWCVALFVASLRRQTGLPVSRRRRGGDLLRVDRLHRERSRRGTDAAADDAAQIEEQLDAAEPTASRGNGVGRADDERRPPRRGGRAEMGGGRSRTLSKTSSNPTSSRPRWKRTRQRGLTGTSFRQARVRRCSGGWSALPRNKPGRGGSRRSLRRPLEVSAPRDEQSADQPEQHDSRRPPNSAGRPVIATLAA